MKVLTSFIIIHSLVLLRQAGVVRFPSHTARVNSCLTNTHWWAHMRPLSVWKDPWVTLTLSCSSCSMRFLASLSCVISLVFSLVWSSWENEIRNKYSQDRFFFFSLNEHSLSALVKKSQNIFSTNYPGQPAQTSYFISSC